MESTQKFMNFTPVIGAAGTRFAMFTYMWLLKQPAGNAKMTGIAGLIESGSMTFLRKEYTILVGFLALITGFHLGNLVATQQCLTLLVQLVPCFVVSSE